MCRGTTIWIPDTINCTRCAAIFRANCRQRILQREILTLNLVKPVCCQHRQDCGNWRPETGTVLYTSAGMLSPETRDTRFGKSTGKHQPLRLPRVHGSTSTIKTCSPVRRTRSSCRQRTVPVNTVPNPVRSPLQKQSHPDREVKMSSLKDRILAGMGNFTPQHGNYHTALPEIAIPSHSHRGNELGAVKMQPTVMVGIRANHVSVQDRSEERRV